MKTATVFLVGSLLIGMTSCSHFDQKKDKSKKENIAYSLIENFLHNGASFQEIKKILGKPERHYKHKDIPEKVYIYNNKKNNFKEWSFGVNKLGKVMWLNHKPWSNPLLDRVEVLPQTWEKYSCEKKREPDTSVSHVIQEDTFFECAGGRIRAYYNVHGEIGTISVDGP